jgi:hypothetical protein
LNRARAARALALVAVALASARGSLALPTMVRLGYNDCASCHVSPQGGGLLNPYGRGIDKAQSLVGGDYQLPSQELPAPGSTRGITHDLRTVLQWQDAFPPGAAATSVFRPRIMYRNVTGLGHGLRVTAAVTADGERAPRPSRPYEPASQPTAVFVNTALVQWRGAKGLELAAGRDQLPTGINVPDLAPYIRSRNRLGYYDAPTQLKAYWWGRRQAFVPYVFAPGGNEADGEREFGGGFLYELDVLGRQRTVVGVGLLHGDAGSGSRNVATGYVRLGFGSWGLLAEHDVTDRTREGPAPFELRQQASYAQLFWAIREWLVASAIGERLDVEAPFRQRLIAGRLELAARLASQATIVAGGRLERDQLTGRQTPAVTLQLALKTAR